MAQVPPSMHRSTGLFSLISWQKHEIQSNNLLHHFGCSASISVFQLFISNETNQKAATLIGTLRKMSPSMGSLWLFNQTLHSNST